MHNKPFFLLIRFDERKILIFVGILFMIIGRILMLPIPGRDPPRPPDDPSTTTVEPSTTTVYPFGNETTPNPNYAESDTSSKLQA
jgi:hypothetical protein